MYPDRLLMLFARRRAEPQPGRGVIYDVKCTGHLAGRSCATAAARSCGRPGIR
jgi:hypothetical protein